jgi:hypothetical protein
MRTLALTILTIGMVLTAGHARAQRFDPAYPVCLYVVPWGGGSYYRCTYQTMDDCRAFADGQMCVPNPYYANATAPVRGTNRHSRSRAHAESRSYVPREHRAAPYNQYNGSYYGADQGYAPGEKERFFDSLRRYQ